MTDINSQEDFLRALEENPQWKEAIRLHVLGEEVLQLPIRFNVFLIRTEAFMERTEAYLADQNEFNRQQVEFNRKVEGFMERTEAFMADQAEFNRKVTTFMADQTEFNRKVEGFMERTEALLEQQAEFNRQVLVRFGRMEGDIGNLKGFYAEYKVIQHARFVVRELDDALQYVRTVPAEEMEQLGLQAIAGGLLPRAEWRSFMEADLVIEATDGANPCYLTVEVSYTGDRRDADRARRNARIISELLGCSTRPGSRQRPQR